jgi:hypothetical protein
MSTELVFQLITALMAGAFAGLGAYMAIRIEIAVMTEKLDRTIEDLDHLKSKLGEL